ncbi:uncharacterized protein EDB93DRAFT_1088480 [Suillus bovinus]|uniref:uncharacterized protein n=1 Tax=Suillus bovinus TaxID=48563 RepID=UPI001B8707C4|nr:uncharacterized protein EDB93DRAFT_1088480 [Suillus bovinus]KAG2142816.1 hypothetical protein EDB93DRAFT_1088480 [Suillus bovinus]
MGPYLPPTSASKASCSFVITVGSKVSEDTLKSCADLFSSDYGIWDDQASTISKYTLAGKRVKMTAAKLRTQCLSHPENTLLVTYYIQVDPLDIKVAFSQLHKGSFLTISCRSSPSDFIQVGWVTQLVVDKAVRQHYIATQLLQTLKFHTLFSSVNIVGPASSHPAACNVLAKYAAANIKDVNLDFIREHAKGVLESSPISYVKAAQLRGTLFEDNCNDRAISSVYTKFYVDHAEYWNITNAKPLAVLEQYKKKGPWCLGELLDGHEFLAIFPIAPMSPVDPKS